MPRETKAEKEAREAAKKVVEATEEPKLEAVPDLPEQPEAPPAVHLLVERAEDGSVKVEPVGTGDIRVTEVESIIRMGLKRWLEKSGLGS